MKDSRLPGFHRQSIAERIDELTERGWLSDIDAAELRRGDHVLPVHVGDKIIENVIATFGLPLAVAPNFCVNDRDYVVPLVIEEPSVVAALSASARLARAAGGFEAHCDESLAVGQIHLTDVKDVSSATTAVSDHRQELLDAANAIHPRLLARGGGVRDIEVHTLSLDGGRRTLALHLLVDTVDAMGANLVNTICEAVAPRVAEIAGASVAMCILSNLSDRSLVSARVRYRLEDLGADETVAMRDRDAIVLASDIAAADPYRAATHNKGVMNGIDALAIATGNDWRAIEAGAHAYAARGSAYTSLTRWSVAGNGDLAGEIRLPLKVGTVGGTLEANRGAAIGLGICGVDSASELAELMAAVGLAQNFAAIRALATTGIQQGHMRMHARSVTMSAGVPDALFDDVVTELVASGEIKEWNAREILDRKLAAKAEHHSVSAAGKVILLGEHAVVYGSHALALPIENAMTAIATASERSSISIPAWGVSEKIDEDASSQNPIGRAVSLIARELDLRDASFDVEVASLLPGSMGLGSSATLAVVVTRALAAAFDIELGNDRISAIAFECEKLAHGTPSGIDNSIATYGVPLLFRRGESILMDEISLREDPPIVIACSSRAGSTRDQVAGVRRRRDAEPERYDALFGQIDDLTLAAVAALTSADYDQLGQLMNICHGLLNALQVSTPELERMVAIAREAGATGAKLTGAGGGGSIVAVCPGRQSDVKAALETAGFKTINPL